MDVLPTSSSYYVYPTLPPLSILKFTPSKNPPPLSPPVKNPNLLAHPFTIPPHVYHNALNIAWPLSISLLYAATVAFFNRINAKRNHKPWAFSNTTAFFVLVVAHNVFLALYSCWTFVGMATAFKQSWPGWRNEYGSAGVADSLCKLHGPRGLGSAATYQAATGSWTIADVSMKLAGGLPDTTDVGRIWNEGLSYYGWLFYLSKFYEVLDTAIVLTKGKKSSFLQTYHHTGAMFGMWAGIRFMSPPIWMFTCINSFIHTWMYAYYTLAAFGIRVPTRAKRGLTAAQTFQIVFGASYALVHLFISYDIPTYAPFRILNSLSTALPSAYEAASSVGVTPRYADLGSRLKKAALRAAGQEGLAENVRNREGLTFGIDAIHAAEAERAQEEIKYKLQTTRTHCLDTSGQVFAILLNLFYLVPLAYLFISFFVSNFEKGAKNESQKADKIQNAKASADKAAKDLAGQIAEAMGDRQGGATEPPPELKAKLNGAKDNVKKKSTELKDNAERQSHNVNDKVKEDLEKLRARAQQGAEKVKDHAPEVARNAQDSVKNAVADAKKYADSLRGSAERKAGEAKDSVMKRADANGQKQDEGEKDTGKTGADADDQKQEDMENGPQVKQEDADGDVKPEGNETNGDNENADGKEPNKEDSEDFEDPGAYEVNPDELLGGEEKKAEDKMQPNGA